MAKKVISYKLNADGTVPDFVEDGGYLAKEPNDTSNMVVIGVSKDGADLSGAVEVFDAEADCLAYVSTYESDSTTTDPITGEERTFIVADAVATIFAKIA